MVNGKKKEVNNFQVRINNKEYTYTPGFKALKALVAMFGDETKEWVGKKFQIKLVTMEAFGEERQIIRPKRIEEKP